MFPTLQSAVSLDQHVDPFIVLEGWSISTDVVAGVRIPPFVVMAF